MLRHGHALPPPDVTPRRSPPRPAGGSTVPESAAPSSAARDGRIGGGALRALSAARSVWRLWFFAALVALWWVLSAHSTSTYFPPLSAIVHRLYRLWIVGNAKSELVPSLEHFAVGYAIAGVLGIVGGALLWRFRRVGEAVSPLLYFVYVLPAAAVLPALVALLGIGAAMKVTVIVLASVWPTLLNTVDGMRSTDQVKLDTARTLHMTPARTVRSVVLPAALPQIMAGLRNSLQIAIIMMVVSELIASTSGIGFFILNAQQKFAVTDMWTGIIVLAIVGSALTLVFIGVERILLGWYIGARTAEEKR